MDPRAPSAEEDRCLPPLQQREVTENDRKGAIDQRTCYLACTTQRRGCRARRGGHAVRMDGRAQSGTRMGFLGQRSPCHVDPPTLCSSMVWGLARRRPPASDHQSTVSRVHAPPILKGVVEMGVLN